MNFFNANGRLAEPRTDRTAYSTAPLPEPAGPEATAESRAAIIALAGPPSVTPFSATLGDLIAAWFAPLDIGDDGGVRGYLDGVSVQVNALNVREVLRRPAVAGQLGVEVTAADLDAALALVAQRARAEHERRVVAEDHQRERERAGLVEDVAVAEKRARLLRELAELEGTPLSAPVADARSVPSPPPSPPPRRWRRS